MSNYPRDPYTTAVHAIRGGLALFGLLAILGVLALISGCMSATTAARHVLEDTARVGAQIDQGLAAERVRVSEEIIARPDATRAEHDEAMAPFDEALEITQRVRDAHLIAQTALDAAEHGEAEAWRPLMMCVLSGLSQLVGVAAQYIDLPDEVGEILQTLAGLAEGACPAPEPAEGGAR